MSERLQPTEKGPEIPAGEYERKVEELQNSSEQESTEADQGRQVESARAKIEQQAEAESRVTESQPTEPAYHPTRLDKSGAYQETMRSLQRRLKPTARAFSKVIHMPTVEKTSDFAAKTVFRPSVTLGATTAALLVGGSAYLTARYYGFGLSGSEFILSLVLGGVIGLLIEAVSKLLRRNKA